MTIYFRRTEDDKKFFIDEYFNKDIDAYLDFIKENTEIKNVNIDCTRVVDDVLEMM